MSENDSEIIKAYLKEIENSKFLTKAEEQVIGRRIKDVEQEILTTCLKSPIFIQELKTICESVERNANNAVKYSKDLIDDSPKEDKIRTIDQFSEILTLINSDKMTKANLSLLNKLVGYINLTSSALTQMITPIKKRYETVNEYFVKTKANYRFFEVENDSQYNELVFNCQDPTYRRELARTLYTDDNTLVRRLQQQEEIVNYLNTEGVINKTAHNALNKLVSNIVKLEVKYKEDREILIKAHLPLVVARAKKFNSPDVNLEDLIQEGNIGLIKAVDKFDPDKNVKISTYATWWIDQAIRRSISNKSRLVRIPIHTQQNLKKINAAFFTLSQKLKREPTLAEIAEETGIKLRNLNEKKADDPSTVEGLMRTALHESGMDSEISEGLTFNDILFDKEQQSSFSKLANDMTRDKVRQALSSLSPRSEKIIRLRFGIGVPREHTLEEIGVKFGVTKERIRQIEAKELKKLKGNKKMGDVK